MMSLLASFSRRVAFSASDKPPAYRLTDRSVFLTVASTSFNSKLKSAVAISEKLMVSRRSSCESLSFITICAASLVAMPVFTSPS